MKNYLLMHKNDVVAIINIQPNGLHLNKMINSNLMPIGIMNLSVHADYNLTSWNDKRCIPSGRPNYQSLTNTVGIRDQQDWIARSHMCSLTDCYWFKEEVDSTTWEDVNFHKNGFSSNLYRVLFYSDFGTRINNLNSPDITTDGCLPKMWIERDGAFYLVKDSQGQRPMESYCEWFASKLFQKMGVDCVDYNIEIFNNRDCCVSKCFIQSDSEEFVPMHDLLMEYDYTMRDVVKLMRELGFEDEIEKMIVCDYLIGNTDRHSRNLGVIIDSNTGEIKRFAPLFDNGVGHITINGDSLYYHVGDSHYLALMQDVSTKSLEIVNRLAQSDLHELVDGMRCLTDAEKNTAVVELTRRINIVNEIIIDRGHEYDRDR